MITYPNSVIVASPTQTANAKGFVQVYGEGQVAVATADDTKIYIGVDTGDVQSYVKPDGTAATISRKYFSSPIDLSRVVSISAEKYTAPANEVTVVTVDPAMVIPAVGEEYCIRFIYKDVAGFPGQFSQTFRAVANTGATVNSILTSLATQINRDVNSRITASVATNVMTITAKEVTDNPGLNSINDYSQVSFTTVFFRAARQEEPVVGVEIEITTAPNPGFGYWKVVRDREKKALGYRGITNPELAFPVIKPSSFVVEGTTYDTVVVESAVEYQSPDNSYKKETTVVTEIYLPTGSAAAFVTALSGLLPAVVKTVKAGVYKENQTLADALA